MTEQQSAEDRKNGHAEEVGFVPFRAEKTLNASVLRRLAEVQLETKSVYFEEAA